MHDPYFTFFCAVFKTTVLTVIKVVPLVTTSMLTSNSIGRGPTHYNIHVDFKHQSSQYWKRLHSLQHSCWLQTSVYYSWYWKRPTLYNFHLDFKHQYTIHDIESSLTLYALVNVNSQGPLGAGISKAFRHLRKCVVRVPSMGQKFLSSMHFCPFVYIDFYVKMPLDGCSIPNTCALIQIQCTRSGACEGHRQTISCQKIPGWVGGDWQEVDEKG